jgi:hypothetical protein
MEGLTLEVKLLPDNIADDCSCHEMADKDRRLLPAVKKVLEQKIFQTPELLHGAVDRGIFTAAVGAKRSAVELAAPATGRRRRTKKTGAGKAAPSRKRRTRNSSRATPRPPMPGRRDAHEFIRSNLLRASRIEPSSHPIAATAGRRGSRRSHQKLQRRGGRTRWIHKI